MFSHEPPSAQRNEHLIWLPVAACPNTARPVQNTITGKRQLGRITGRSDGNNVAVGLNDGTVESVRSGSTLLTTVPPVPKVGSRFPFGVSRAKPLTIVVVDPANFFAEIFKHLKLHMLVIVGMIGLVRICKTEVEICS
jgi:hypothetical protein